MKKLLLYFKSLVIFLLLLSSSFSWGQNVNETFSNEINKTFAGLDKNKVPNGLLLDFAMEFTDVAAFEGKLKGLNPIDVSTYTDLYHTMLMSRVRNVTDGFLLPQHFAEKWERYRRDENPRPEGTGTVSLEVPTIVLSGLYYEYSKIKESALTQGHIAVSNNQYKDVYKNGQWQNPYEKKEVFAIASPISEISGHELSFILPEELWLSNKTPNVAKIEIELRTGYFRQIEFGRKVTFNYMNIPTDGGFRDISFRLTLHNGRVLNSKIRIKTDEYNNNGRRPERAEQIIIVQSEDDFNGKHAKGVVSINYAEGRREILKPLIVAEGFDPGIITSPENIFGVTNINDFLEEIAQSGSPDLDELLSFDPTQDYDIIYLDWLNGVDDMRRNAELLETVIHWVNNEKRKNGSTEKNVVLGQSMGGVIARYALREMEIQNEDHETRLYISHDAPHQGANVPYGLQYMARHARNEYVKAPVLFGLTELIIPTAVNVLDFYSQHGLNNIGFNTTVNPFPSPYAMLTLADMPASRQLLSNFVDRNYTRDNSIFNNWQDELETRGYPREYGIRKIAIGNGSECAITQEFDPGDYLFRFYGESSPAFLNGLLRMITDPLVGYLLSDMELTFTSLLPGSSKYKYDIWAKTIPTGSNKQVYKGRIVYTKKLLFLIPIDVVLMNKNIDAPSGSLPIDTYPGGYYDVKANVNLNALPSFLSDRITHIENFNFIPVTSSLDIGLGKTNMYEEDYLRSYSGGTPPVAPKETPFDNFITAFNTNSNLNPNEQHISFSRRNGNWLADELELEEGENAPIANCNFICNQVEIIGPDAICGTSAVYSFPSDNITWTISNSSKASIIPTGHSVKVTAKSEGAVTLTARITDLDCGATVNVTKQIYLGSSVRISLDRDAGYTEARANITGNNLSNPSFSIVGGSGFATVNLVNNYGSYTIVGRGSTNTWNKTIKLNITTSCGRESKTFTLTPPPMMPPPGCLYSLQNISADIYALRPPPDQPCSSTAQEQQFVSTSNVSTFQNTYFIKVFDMNGVLLLETTENSINLESLTSGYYIIKGSVNGEMTTKKVAKN